jgi:hypothetical protein
MTGRLACSNSYISSSVCVCSDIFCHRPRCPSGSMSLYETEAGKVPAPVPRLQICWQSSLWPVKAWHSLLVHQYRCINHITIGLQALERLAQLDRVVSKPGGAALICGQAGVGRKSALALVAYMHHMEVCTLYPLLMVFRATCTPCCQCFRLYSAIVRIPAHVCFVVPCSHMCIINGHTD